MVVGVEHCELELHIVSDEGNPFTCFFGVKVYKIFNVNLSLVVLRVGSVPVIPNLVVANIFGLDYSTFLEIPFDHLSAKNVVGRALNGVALLGVSVGHHGLVAAHLHRSSKDYSEVVS